MYVTICVYADAYIPQYTYRDQKIATGIRPHVPYCLSQDLFFLECIYQGWRSMRFQGASVFNSHLNHSSMGLKTCADASFMWVLGTASQDLMLVLHGL